MHQHFSCTFPLNGDLFFIVKNLFWIEAVAKVMILQVKLLDEGV